MKQEPKHISATNRGLADPKDRLFVVALVVQLLVSTVLGAAIVGAVNRAGDAPVQVVHELPSQSVQPSVQPTGSSGSRTMTTVLGGRKVTTDQTVGVSAGEIKIGGLFTLSGPGDGTVALHAVQAYFNMVNATGGVHGRKLRYVTRDDKFDPSIGFAATKDLAENQKVFAMASWVAPNSENDQTIKYLTDRGIPLVGNFGQPAEYKSRISYPFSANWTVSPRLVVRHLAKVLGMKKIALVWVHLTNEIDGIVTSSANDEAAKWGAKIVYTEAADVAKPVYDDTVVNAQGNGADGMGTILDAFSASRYWQSFARGSWRPPQVGYAFAMDPQPTQVIPSGYEEVYGIQEMELPGNQTPPVAEYLAKMKKYYPGDMDKLSWGSELTWLGAKMLVAGLERAGPNPTREGLLAAFDSMTDFDSGFAPPYTIRPGNHDFINCMKAAKLTSTRTWVQSSDWFCV
ncbi:MAG: ABC transporter substrate-binding protein [Actinomycetota bacterium]